jgi:hypothetical protein
MTLRRRIVFLTMACSILTACGTRPPITRAELVGSYVYRSEDPATRATDHQWDHLTLQADGKYELVQGGPTKSRTETAGTWTLVPWGGVDNGPSLSLDHAGYPVQIKGQEVRLLIDEDTGIWYVKVK